MQLVNARDIKNAPGRPKTHKLDSAWQAKLTEQGPGCLPRPSQVPGADRRRNPLPGGPGECARFPGGYANSSDGLPRRNAARNREERRRTPTRTLTGRINRIHRYPADIAVNVGRGRTAPHSGGRPPQGSARSPCPSADRRREDVGACHTCAYVFACHPFPIHPRWCACRYAARRGVSGRHRRDGGGDATTDNQPGQASAHRAEVAAGPGNPAL